MNLLSETLAPLLFSSCTTSVRASRTSSQKAYSIIYSGHPCAYMYMVLFTPAPERLRREVGGRKLASVPDAGACSRFWRIVRAAIVYN